MKREDGGEEGITPSLKIKGGELFTFSSGQDSVQELWSTHGMEPKISSFETKRARYKRSLVKVVASRRHPAIGRKLSELPLEDDPVQGSIVAVSRGGLPVDSPMPEVRVESGDIFILEVDDKFYFENRNEVKFATTQRLTEARIQRTNRAVAATLITIGMVVVAAFGWMSMLNAALIAAGLMVLTGCMNLGAAGRSIEFETLVIIACAIGLEAAVSGSGLTAAIADPLNKIAGDNPYTALTVVFVGCIIMDTLITNVASAVFMFPIALYLAEKLDVSFMPFAVVVMVGASCSFISPMGYPTNLMVYGPGGYKFTDYVKIGVPLTIVVGIVTIFLTPIFFSFLAP